jgi:hypothetical protein
VCKNIKCVHAYIPTDGLYAGMKKNASGEKKKKDYESAKHYSKVGS